MIDDKFGWKSCYQQVPIEPDIYFKFVCFYQAITELYDRGLTNERSPYDKTEAYFGGISREYKKYSDWYGERLYNQIVEYIRNITNQPFDIRRWKKEIRQQYSAQGWINVFEHFKSENDEIIMDMIEKILNRKEDEERHISIKNPFLHTK